MTVEIKDSWVWPEKEPPTKVYLQKSCTIPKSETENHLAQFLKREAEKGSLQQYGWLIALVGNDLNIDLFGYNKLPQGVWPGNPLMRGWHLHNGVYQNRDDFTSTDGLILLGAEERLRRNRRDLQTYIGTTLHPFDVNTKF